MDEKIIIPFITLIVGLIGGYFLTFISDRRKHVIEHRKELRIAYARWFSLQRTAFHQITLLIESVASPSENLEQYTNVQEELKEFQSTLSTLLQTIAEVSLLETNPDRLKVIKAWDNVLNEIYHSLLRHLQAHKYLVETRKRLDGVVILVEEKRNEIEEMQTDSHLKLKNAFLAMQTSIKEINKTTVKFDKDIREFFQTLEGKL
ncbi:MAG: hypothetical protein M3R14_04690 [Acidobacteriota bacterium]|jgi:predicted RND superfamily exporter protein|nr:hypothetical protein [Acidobacteriota bacterium]